LDAGLAAAFGPDSAPATVDESVLHALGFPADSLPRVQLRDPGTEPITPVLRPGSPEMPAAEAADRGGRYQFFGEIARGGMGAVHKGRDADLSRDIAVKVLLEAHQGKPELLQRFVEEAQIGGQLQHPGVVPVYALGKLADGRPFFAMKLVKGRTLSALLAERKELSADRARFLAIFQQVCQTLAYAHARGVIHRDLKPSNVMVGAFGEVQVMDWGLAKVLKEGGVADEHRAPPPEEVSVIRTARSAGSGSESRAGSVLGTPAYMAPEQARGEVDQLDERCDVFGLGAILCQVLTGQPPYTGRDGAEVLRQAQAGDTATALARLDGCGADAELVALAKACLAPAVGDRPRDARAVAHGVTAYLDGVQVRLRQAELAEAEAKAKAIEEGKRRRLTLALAATVLLAATLGGGGWLYFKSERDARQTQVAREVNDALNKGTALREQAKAANVGSAALFAQAREQVQRARALVESGPADDTLKTQVTRLQTELDEEEKDRQLLAALDEAHLKQAETLSQNRFANERAVPLFREAFRAYGLPVGEGDPTAIAQRIRQRPAAVREAIVAVLDEWDVLAGNPKIRLAEPHREWLRAVLSATEPQDAWTRQVRDGRAEKDGTKRRAALAALAASVDVEKVPISALTRLAALDVLGEEDALEPAAAAKLLRRVQAHSPGDFWVNEYLGKALQRVTPPEREEAVRFLTAAVALRPESPGAHLNLGGALYYKGQFDEAIACYHKAIELDAKYAAAHVNLGRALKEKGQLDEAIACYRRAVELDPKFAHAHFNMGLALKARGQVEEAIACYKRAIDFGPKHATAHNNLGWALYGKGQVDEAIACYKRAIDLDPKLDIAHINLGLALARKGHEDEAIACLRKAIKFNPKHVHAHHNLGNALNRKGQVDEAIACWREVIELDPKYAAAHTNLGIALANKGQLDDAITCFQKAIEYNPKSAGYQDNLALALMDKGQIDEAITCFKKAIALDPKFAQPRTNLAKAERLAATQDKFAAFQNRSYTPASNDERLGLAEWCRVKKLPRTATGLYAFAFAADPKLADDLLAAHRYSAACFAALAAAGQGDDAAKLDDQERTRLRQQARDWLRADLALRRQQHQTGEPADRAAVQQALRHWQQDTDLAGIRDAAALAKLSAEEQKAFTQLWAEVAALRKKAEGNTK
jgi:serine/threonine-protein kinase